MSVHSLSDLKKREKEEEKKQEANFFTGGNRSGLAIGNPVAGLMQQLAQRAARNAAEPGPGEVGVKITVWANGFQVDGSPLRGYDAPESIKFAHDISQGRAPAELQAKAQGKRVALRFEDRSSDVFSGSRPANFSGQGVKLSRTNSTPIGSVNPSVPAPYFNPNYPQVTVRVVFHDGQQRELTVNETTRVGDIRDFVTAAAPVAGQFELVAGFPLTPLQNARLTVQEAEIANAQVRQNLV